MLTVQVTHYKEGAEELWMHLAQGQTATVGEEVLAKEAHGQKRNLGVWKVEQVSHTGRCKITPVLTQPVLF